VSASIGAKRGHLIIDSDTDDENNNTQSDLVRICLNLAFLPEDRGRAFQYSKDKLAMETSQRIAAYKKQEDENDMN